MVRLADASALYLGEQRVAAVYLGPAQVFTGTPANPYTGLLPGQLVTNSGMFNSQVTFAAATTPGEAIRTTFKAVATLTSLQLTWIGIFNAVGTGGTLTGSDITVKAAVEYNGAVVGLFTFGGASRTGTLLKGGSLSTDKLTLTTPIPAGALFAIRRFVVADANSLLPRGFPSGGPNYPALPPVGDGINTSAGDITDTTGAMNVGSYSDFPPIVTGDTVQPLTRSLFALGDSITAAVGDSSPAYGYAVRAAAGLGIPILRYALAGQAAQTYSTSTAPWEQVLPGISDAIVLIGHNDMTGRSSDQVKSYLVPIWKRVGAQGVRVHAGTLMPRTTSTDSWATLGGQTVVSGHDTKRVAVNDWIRDGAPVDAAGNALAIGATTGAIRIGEPGHPVVDFYDFADLGESSRNSSLWKVNGTPFYSVADGTHPSPLVHQQMADLIGVSWGGVIAPPTALTLTATPGAGQVTITATGGAGTGVTYALYRGTTATGSPIATSLPFTDAGRTNGTPVSYIATATNTSGTVTSAVVSATPQAVGTAYDYLADGALLSAFLPSSLPAGTITSWSPSAGSLAGALTNTTALTVSENAVNGKRAVEFNGTSDLMTTAAFGTPVTSPTTTILVVRTNATGSKTIFASSTGGIVVGHDGPGHALLFERTAANSNSTAISETKTMALATWHLIVAVADGTTGRLYVDSVTPTTGALPGVTPGYKTFRVGAHSQGPYFQGAIAEAAVVGRAITQQEAADLLAALATKYGKTLV